MQPSTVSKSLHWFLEQPTHSKYRPSLSLGEELRLCSVEKLKMRMVQLFRLEFVHVCVFKHVLYMQWNWLTSSCVWDQSGVVLTSWYMLNVYTFMNPALWS